MILEKMNVIAIIFLIAVSLESISASRRIVYKSPPSQKPSIEKSPSLKTTTKTNISNESATVNVPVTAKNTSKPVAKLPSLNRQPSKNDLENVPAPAKDTPKPIAKLTSLSRQQSKIDVKNVPEPTLSQSPKLSPLGNKAKANTDTDAVSEPKTTPEISQVPISYKVLEKGKVTIVKGENGKVYVDDVYLFDYPEDLKKGKLRFTVTANNDVLVNDRLVLTKRSQDPLIIPINPNINEDGITWFQVRIDKYGYLHYTSNKGLSKTFAAGK